jgi:hypothetical protein
MAKKSVRKARGENVPMSGRQIANAMVIKKKKTAAKKRSAKTAAKKSTKKASKEKAKKSKRG